MDKPRLSLKVAEWALLLLLAAIFVWRGLIPGWKTLNTDFPNYYLVARLYRQGYTLDRVYDWSWLAREKDHAGIDRPVVGFIPLTLVSMLPVAPLAMLPPLTAKHYWLIANLIMLGLTVVLLNGMTQLGWRRVAILALLALDPLRTNFLYGQLHILVLLLLALAAWAHFTRRPGISGAILAAASAVKIYPALFVFYFLRKKQWRGVTGLLVGCIFFAGLSIILFGYSANKVYVLEVLPRALSGASIDPYSVDWNSLTALLRRLFIAEPELNPHPLADLPAAFAFLQPLCQALLFVPFLWLISSAENEPGREKLEWGGYAALLLILSTNPASYHFCVLILAVVLVAEYLRQAGNTRQFAALVSIYALACLPIFRWAPASPSGWYDFLSFPRLYALLALWFFLLWTLVKTSEPSFAWCLRTREAGVFAALLVFLLMAGAWSNLRNLRGQFNNYAKRVVTTPGSLMATEAAAAGHSIWFVSMLPRGYGLTALSNGNLIHFELGGDAFHPSLCPTNRQLWVELSSLKSRIVRIPLNDEGASGKTPVTEFEDAAQPAVSPDGRWLAFVREQRGRGSLWVAGLGAGNNLRGTCSREIAGPEYDVWDASFSPKNKILYSARPRGVLQLFSADPVSSAITPIPTGSSAPSRFPVESPDGKSLVYSREESGAWHLIVLNRTSHAESRLTDGLCNSTAPTWLSDSKTIIYATDCGRGLGLTALCHIRAVP